MRVIPGLAAAMAALVIVPGWSFYYDVTPKAAVVLLAAVLASIHLIVTPRVPRGNMIFGAAFTGSLVLSAALSPYVSWAPSLVWFGSNWRRSGAVAMIAVIVIAVAASVFADRVWLLRSMCVAGVLAGAYAIAQYFGWDPWLPVAGYHFGEGEYRIVRPPGTMGHANYLAAFLLWPVFSGVALWRSNDAWRWVGVASSGIGVVAILLCGSRGAWAGLIAGAIALAAVARPRWKVVAGAAAAIVMAGALFYVSPAGERLRARLFWIGEDAAGGARLLLWRDTLRMIGDRPVWGYGPEVFPAAFAERQSAELSRAYPDFYHESPHNMFLDVLAGQGLVGLAVLAGWIAMALWRGWKRDVELFAALVAALVAHQFAVFVLPTALLFFLTLATLHRESLEVRVPRWLLVPVAAAMLVIAYRTVAADAALARVRAALDGGDAARAADLWGEGVRYVGVSADLYFSRRWVEAAGSANDALSKLRYGQLAGLTGAAATRSPEQQQNAYYSFAQLQAAAGDNAAVETGLRGAIAAAPTWYKPHWALARLLWLMGRREEARKEARVALDLNGGRDAEVAQTLEEILRSGHAAH